MGEEKFWDISSLLPLCSNGWLLAVAVSFSHHHSYWMVPLSHLQFSLEREVGYLLLSLQVGSDCGSPGEDPVPIGQPSSCCHSSNNFLLMPIQT